MRYVLILIMSFCLTQEITASPTWMDIIPGNSPGARLGASMAFDPTKDLMYLFGGFNGGANLGDTWSWDGSDWTQIMPTDSPSGRDFASMSYDPVTKTLILFGGSNSTGFLQDTWSWDGSDWRQITTSTTPGIRGFASMAIDTTGQVILFGGGNTTTIFGDTWKWDGTLLNWVLLSAGSMTTPAPRYGATLAANTTQLILFGGTNSATDFGDTWKWDGTTWTELNPGTMSTPMPRNRASMGYNSATGQMILFGGQYGGNPINYLGDTWNWDGSTWGEITPLTPPPDARSLASMAYDPTTCQLTLFGGKNGTGIIFDDTWNWGEESVVPDVIANPPSQTICSGSTTSIGLRSNVPGTIFSWTVMVNRVANATSGSGPSIAQTLTATGNVAGTATYTVTPSAPGGCGEIEGSPITVVVTVPHPPANRFAVDLQLPSL